jgi:hypothetical protein
VGRDAHGTAMHDAALAKQQVLAASLVAGEAIAHIKSGVSSPRAKAALPAAEPDGEWKEF